MSEERKATLALLNQHYKTVEEKLFQVIQQFSAKESMTAADVSALAAITDSFVCVHNIVL